MERMLIQKGDFNMKQSLILLQLSSLHKVFLDENYAALQEIGGLSALKGERVSYQILYTCPEEGAATSKIVVDADERIRVKLRNVGCVPSLLPARPKERDGYYLRTEPGLYPDVLYPLTDNTVNVTLKNCHSLFVTAEIPEDMPAGDYPIRISFRMPDETVTKTFTIRVLNGVLPKQELTYTQWFHADCIASFYHYEPLSEEHWAMIEKFVDMAAYTGVTQILTPLFTPPLDTEVGRERPTVQLMDVRYVGGVYSFGFDKLKRWINMCKAHGIEKFEIAHLFTQWGTGCTPKIEAETETGKKKIFGWHVKADSPEYREFLNCMLPALTAFLKAEGVYENTCFHVSDEPNFEKDYEIYKTEREMLEGLIPAEKLMDAVSHYEFCDCGLVKHPVAVTRSVDEFFAHGYKDIWTYYCCGPCDQGYSNRFYAMPSGRNRIIGAQLYKYNIHGFLHWGYNFYYSALSKRLINPFYETDADENFPSGDAYTVYPGQDGPIESLRSVVFYEGLQDLRACALLERCIGRDAVVAILEESGTIKFNEYPRTDAGVLEIRNRINRKLEEVLPKA